MIESVKKTEIAKHLGVLIPNLIGPKDTVAELNCSDTYFAEIFKKCGIKFIGLNPDEVVIEALKKSSPAIAKFLKVGSQGPKGAGVFFSFLNHDFNAIPKGVLVILVSHGHKNYDETCLALAPHIATGAATVQFGEFFLTIGVHK